MFNAHLVARAIGTVEEIVTTNNLQFMAPW